MTMKTISFALLASLALGASAQDKPRSLNDARQGNTTGIVIWEQNKAPAAAAAAPASAAAPAAAGGPGPAMNAAKAEPPGSTSAGSALGRFFSTIREHNPPSGKSLGNAKKLDTPGIPLPTAPASAPR